MAPMPLSLASVWLAEVRESQAECCGESSLQLCECFMTCLCAVKCHGLLQEEIQWSSHLSKTLHELAVVADKAQELLHLMS